MNYNRLTRYINVLFGILILVLIVLSVTIKINIAIPLLLIGIAQLISGFNRKDTLESKNTKFFFVLSGITIILISFYLLF